MKPHEDYPDTLTVAQLILELSKVKDPENTLVYMDVFTDSAFHVKTIHEDKLDNGVKVICLEPI